MGDWLDGRTNHKLTCVPKWLCEGTGPYGSCFCLRLLVHHELLLVPPLFHPIPCADAYLEEHEMKKYYPYSDVKVYLSKEEMNTIKEFGPPGTVCPSPRLLFAPLTISFFVATT